MNTEVLNAMYDELDGHTQGRVDTAVDRVVEAKERGEGVVVVTGSGPNIHEGVTTLIAELMRVGIVDGVSTSSAVVAHEMGGTLDKVKRCDGTVLPIDRGLLPRGGTFELTLMDMEVAEAFNTVYGVDAGLIESAGNLGYPMGLWIERLSLEILTWAQKAGKSFEEVAGIGADARTMIGQGARLGKPVLVTIPQLVGGGATGLAIGDSLGVGKRAERVARMLDSAAVIIESGVALTQEIHDGPYELYTGHGLWSAWDDGYGFSLEGKSLVRIDLDPALEQVYQAEQGDSAVQRAIADGLPKTKTFKVPFRMEMSGFARHEGSVPIVGDIGVIWPIMARRISERLGNTLEFMSYPQQTDEGARMREWIVDEVRPISRERILEGLGE